MPILEWKTFVIKCDFCEEHKVVYGYKAEDLIPSDWSIVQKYPKYQDGYASPFSPLLGGGYLPAPTKIACHKCAVVKEIVE